ncbi:phage portal protein [Rhizobium rhizogenes]|uniref:Phage portal protein n=1 Tax=Rhizobium rhizogenes NBRC 13257 TaxID=1220581 RepID=A0AA87QCT7_RHIRH|nr:phage portal protein [Rhizobium rhizogenes]NTG60425.1 phage portal protein [Rhizobium rhizogenes]NTG66975.1 phage portal protein [Rhizobium rhizogenes]NTG79947.1 phage portal protein [Rhizobium rhizogenes]NTH95628.1 phage portal protein [Rhizobium rhizogenes]NTI67839.1 phage portal protein [Rhizobium rhizogenes]
MWPFKQPAQEQRIASSDPLLGQFLGARFAGSVDIEKVSNLAVAQACVKLISESIAAAELNVYKLNPAGGAEIAASHPLQSVLVDEAYNGVSSFDMKEAVAAEIATYGNSVLKVHRNGKSQVSGLQHLAWGDVTVETISSTGRPRYRWINPNKPGDVQVLTADEVVHLKYRANGKNVGQSPIALAAISMGIATAMEESQGESAENSFRPSGLISLPDAVDPTKFEALRTSFRDKFLGRRNINSLMVLDNGAKWTPIQFSAADAQLLESRQWAAYDICRIFGVPPSAVGLLLFSNWNSISDESRALVIRCLRPFGKRIEAQLSTALLSPTARKEYYLEHDWSDMLAGDQKTRYEAYAIGKQNGFLNTDEIRARESMGKVKGGDVYLQPLNYAPLGTIAVNGQHNAPQVTQ